jgi:hypothetical protein
MFDQTLISKIKAWLGEEGIDFFKKIKKEHGTLLAIWEENGIPHIVHFREGMDIRNKLRELTNNSWTTNDYDDKWHLIIEECLKER